MNNALTGLVVALFILLSAFSVSAKPLDITNPLQSTVDDFPRASYDDVNNRYLVAWLREGDVYLQSIDLENNARTETKISDGGNSFMPLVVAGSNNRHLVVWVRDGDKQDSSVQGAIVDGSGSVVSRFTVSDAAGKQTAPSVAYDPGTDRFFVVWQDNRYGKFDIRGAFVLSSGAVFSESTIDNSGDLKFPSVEFNKKTGTYLVAYAHDSPNHIPNTDLDNPHIDVLLYDKDGVLKKSASINPNKGLASASLQYGDFYGGLKAMANQDGDGFFVSWVQKYASDKKLLAVEINSDGSVGSIGQKVLLDLSDVFSDISYNYKNGKFIVARQKADNGIEVLSTDFGGYVTSGWKGIAAASMNPSSAYDAKKGLSFVVLRRGNGVSAYFLDQEAKSMISRDVRLPADQFTRQKLKPLLVTKTNVEELKGDKGYIMPDEPFIVINTSNSGPVLGLRFDLAFRNSIDLSQLEVDSQGSRAFVNIKGMAGELAKTKQGLSDYILMLPNDNNGGGVTVCPNAKNIDDVNDNCGCKMIFDSSQILSADVADNLDSITGISVHMSQDGKSYLIYGLTGSGAFLLPDQSTALRRSALAISDQTDAQNRTAGQSVWFKAAYTDEATGLPIKDGSCRVMFDVPPLGPFAMAYKDDDKSYAFDRSFASAGNYFWRVICFSGGYGSQSRIDTVFITPSSNDFVPQPSADLHPVVDLLAPPDNAIYQKMRQFSCRAEDDKKLASVALYTDIINGTWQAYDTKMISDSRTIVAAWDVDVSKQGKYRWNCLATDDKNQSSWALSDRTFTISSSADANACVGDWACERDAGACLSGNKQVEVCRDRNNCDNKNSEVRGTFDCDTGVVKLLGSCRESWFCADWSGCSSGLQGRRCVDRNACGTDIEKPLEIKGCGIGVGDFLTQAYWLFWVLLIALGIAIYATYKKHKKAIKTFGSGAFGH